MNLFNSLFAQVRFLGRSFQTKLMLLLLPPYVRLVVAALF